MRFTPASTALQPPSAQAWWLSFIERDLLVPDVEGIALQPMASVDGAAAAPAALHYLGRLDGLDCWVRTLPEVPAGWRRMPLRAAMLALAPALAGLAGRAAQILEWDRSHRFCGVCATPTVLQAGERARLCPACRHTAYPRLSPAMMALIWRPGELLLARSPHMPGRMYSALAGFVEAGETLEECVHREVAEEVAVSVTDLRYFGSQSWPFPHSLMIAFSARWCGGDIVPQADEIEHAAWFPFDALPEIPARFSVAGHLIRDTVAALRSGQLA